MPKDVYLTQKYVLSDKSLLTSGAKKLCQKFVIELLTEKGSLEYLPERGTTFLSRIKSASKELDVIAAFSVALRQVIKNFKKEYDRDTPSSERLKSASIVNILVHDEAIQILLAVLTMDGRTEYVITPYLPVSE